MAAETIPAAQDLVAWYAEMGVDVGLDEEPVDRLAERTRTAVPETERPATRTDAPTAVRIAPATTPAMPLAETAQAARAVAEAANTLEELRTALAAFEG